MPKGAEIDEQHERRYAMNGIAAMVAMAVDGIVTFGGKRGVRIACALASACALIATHHGHAAAGFKIGGG